MILAEALVHIVYTFKNREMTYFIDNENLVSDAFLEQMKEFLL